MMLMSDNPSAPDTDCDAIEDAAVSLAGQLLEESRALQTPAGRREAATMARLVESPLSKAFTFAMVDQVFRSSDPVRRASRWRRLLDTMGRPAHLPRIDRLLMAVGAAGSRVAPGLVMQAVEHRMRRDSSRVILRGERGVLESWLERRRLDGFRINLNHLGEAVMGEDEAAHRMEIVLGHLENPAVSYLSVKVSSLFSQISLIAREATLDELALRLRRVFRTALAHGKFVNLDMEEYRDLDLTLTSFRRVLGEPEFRGLSAGMVLQAYLPDSWPALQELTAWALARRAAGGAAIKVRLVKGANLAMEHVEAELHGWHAAPFPDKPGTDANFRRMLEWACRPEHCSAMRIGVATHNLFDVALALVLRERRGLREAVEIEMLEGMANHQAEAVRREAGGLLLYAPAVPDHDFLSAMAYLMRRLDENTAPDNFLRELFAMEPGSPAWQRQEAAFRAGWRACTSGPVASRRNSLPPRPVDRFTNEPDTDWTRPGHRAALTAALAAWNPPPLCDPLPHETVMATAQRGQDIWSTLTLETRADLLRKAADVMAVRRFETLACLCHEGKKAVADADAEVSEAIDFARYYAHHAAVPAGLRATPLGITVVAPPWNFPFAIPCGGVLAALIAGNAVILKPAPETARTARLLAEQLWAAGIPRDVMQFHPCPDGEEGSRLITDPRVACVVLTGAWETARLFQSWRPALTLYAETSGKNALVITAQSDRELAIRDLVKSAFGHAGQKCSAASLAILEAEVFDDPEFRRRLRDAAASLPCGPATDARSVVTPLMRPAGPVLERALTSLEPGEFWLLEPHQDQHDPCRWSPGIRVGVQPGSWFHVTECFGPVLGLMRAGSLDEAIALQNAVPYGLTAGLHSLDPDEIERWCARVEAGNLYVNRPITGAVVQRQPFGGWKRSCIGPGAKAGGPQYVWSFLRMEDDPGVPPPADLAAAWKAEWERYFSAEHDPSGLRCEANRLRYRPARGVVLRISIRETVALARAAMASQITGAPLFTSIEEEEPAEAFAERLSSLADRAEFLRSTGPLPDAVLRAAHDAGLNWIKANVTASARAELRFWLREQAVSLTRHRYGQLPGSTT